MNCLTPYSIRHKVLRHWIDVPCGKCFFCIANRVNGWQFRLQQEEKHAKTAHFITFTYNTNHVPINDEGLFTLQKTDLQLFFKKLRKTQEKVPIKYFACGEYGEHTERPHYHAIIFNALDLNKIEQKWDKGAIHRGSVTPQSIGYTLKYMFKRVLPTIHKRSKEFQVMSKGLGSQYLKDTNKAWHNSDLLNRGYLPLPGGGKTTIPRYYKDKIYSDDDKKALNDHLLTQFDELTDQEKILKLQFYSTKFDLQRIQQSL